MTGKCILLSGANGFIGSALLTDFVRHNRKVTALVRNGHPTPSPEVKMVVADLSSLDQLNESAFSGVDTVVHTAAIAEVAAARSEQLLNRYRQINCDATLSLAKRAADAGVTRFIFISSIKVNGEVNTGVAPFAPDDTPNPSDPYGISKHEAEQGLLHFSRESEMEVVIIRLPLVYGLGVKGNFASMVKWVKKGIPLPLGAVTNHRSLLSLENLISFIDLCVDRERSPLAANEIFILSDGVDLSTTELLQMVAKAYGVSSRLIPVPVSWMKFIARLLGRSTVADRIFGDLRVDSSKAQNMLGWQPVVTMWEQLEKMVSID